MYYSIIQSVWVYRRLCFIFPRVKICTFWLPSPISPITHPHALATTSLPSVSISLFLFLLDSTCKRDYMLFFTDFISLSVIPSEPIHVVINGKSSIIYDWIIFHWDSNVFFNVYPNSHPHKLHDFIAWFCMVQWFLRRPVLHHSINDLCVYLMWHKNQYCTWVFVPPVLFSLKSKIPRLNPVTIKLIRRILAICIW